jgi:methylmalonyl-CoA/ethylmalonyl-CoA epimerase
MADYSTLSGNLLGDLVVGVDHVGLCVRDIDAAERGLSALLGRAAVDRENVAPQKTTASFIRFGTGAALELISPMAGNPALERFLDKRGDALHHVAIAVSDLALALARLESAGVELIDRTPRIGAGGHRVAFIHPRAVGGILVELIERHA